MPDLIVVPVATCATNKNWSTQVKGSKGAVYTVSYGPVMNQLVQYGYTCTCKGFKYRGRCKHINTVMAERCGWNWELDPGNLPDEDGRCPHCDGKVVWEQVGV